MFCVRTCYASQHLWLVNFPAPKARERWWVSARLTSCKFWAGTNYKWPVRTSAICGLWKFYRSSAFLANYMRKIMWLLISIHTVIAVQLSQSNSLLIISISVSGTCGQNNRRITFLTPVSGFYLEGHVFSNHSVELNLDCQDQCALARECVSYNIGPKINNKMACELSNSDHLQHPEDLKPRKDWIYRGTKVWSINL